MKHIKLFESFLNESSNELSEENITKILDDSRRLTIVSINNFSEKNDSCEFDAVIKGVFMKGEAVFNIKMELQSNLEGYKAEVSGDNGDYHVIITKELDEKETGAYAAPKFARRPAAGDKGYAYVAKQFGASPGPKKKTKGSRTEEVKENQEPEEPKYRLYNTLKGKYVKSSENTKVTGFTDNEEEAKQFTKKESTKISPYVNSDLWNLELVK